MQTKTLTLFLYFFLISFSAFSQISSLNSVTLGTQTMITGFAGTDFSITPNIMTGVHLFDIPSASTSARGLVTYTGGTQTFGGNKAFNDIALFSDGAVSTPSLAFSSATSTGLYLTLGGDTRINFTVAGNKRMHITADGSVSISNNLIFNNQLDLNISHDSNIFVTAAQDGGINVTTYGGDGCTGLGCHTGTFTGRTASGNSTTPVHTLAYQAMAEFTGKGYYDDITPHDFGSSNSGVFGVYAAVDQTSTNQAAFCAIQTTRINAANDHFSVLIDPAGNLGLTNTAPPIFHTSLPNGWPAATNYDARFLSIESQTSSEDAGLFIQNGSASGGTEGLNIWMDNSENICYIDNIKDDAAAYMLFRLRALNATPIKSLSLTATGNGMGGYATVMAAPVSVLHIDKGTATASDIRWTAGATTGSSATDGLSIGMTTGADGEIHQYEDHFINIYTGAGINHTLRFRYTDSGPMVSGSTGNPSYRTTNTGSSVNAHFLIDPASSISSGFGWGFDLNNGFICTQGNGTRRIEGMSIKPLSVSATAGSEAMTMLFFTQSGGSAASEKARLTSDGKLGIGVSSPSATVHIKAGGTGASTAPLKFNSGSLNTTAEAGASEYNNSFYQTKNSGLRFGEGGIIFENYADGGNGATTAPTQLYAYVTPSGTLAADGEKLEAHYAGIYTAGAGTRDIQVNFGGINIFDTTPLAPPSAASTWDIRVTIIRISSSTARAVVTATTIGMSTVNWVTITDEILLSGMNFGTTNTLEVTGQPGVATANLMVAQLGVGYWYPAANN